MTYVITSQRGWAGVADHLDEAMEFALRISGVPRSDAEFTNSGELLNRKVPTGWRVGVMLREAS